MQKRSIPTDGSPADDALLAGIRSADAMTHAFGAEVADIWKSFGQLKVPAPALAGLQSDYLKQATELWNRSLPQLTMAPAGANPAKAATPLPDRRFAATDWADNPATAYLAQLYLLNAKTLMRLAEHVQGDEKTKQRVRFAVQQWVDASAPSNYLALNPEALRLALETKGESIGQGLQHLWNDIRRGHLSQTDESAFEVGRNVAITEGSVVFENPLFQLIEYRPSTPQVFERPLLLVPPCINKYYVLDLQPENSLVRWTVEQGHRVFVVSWRNPDESIARLTWDQYIEDGPIRAVQVVRDVTGAPTLNTLGFCVGGTILTTALAVLAARGEKPAHSLTLLTTFLDFTDTGVLDLFIDETMVRMREMTLGLDSPGGGALLKAQELASTFSFLRPNDLVWNYVVGNYLKGQTPPPFDLLYWNSDSTNLPGPMYCWYLRNTYLENNLMVPGKLTVCGQPVDLRTVDAPLYVYGSREDHIVPWHGAYRNLAVLKGPDGTRSAPARFVLGASGHIAGVVNPPAGNKRSHWTGAAGSLPADPERWLQDAVEHPGSWWTDWAQWLEPHGGRRLDAPAAPGNDAHRVIEPAPGRYVKQRA